MNRRTLFGTIALSPLMAVTAFAKEDTQNEAPDSASPNLTIQGVLKKDREIMRVGTNSFSIDASFPQYDPNVAVSMSVGKDGKLWLKSAGGEWKRVVTE